MRIALGKNIYSKGFLKSVSLDKALKCLSHLPNNQVRNAWKQAHGLTVRNYKEKVEKSED